jgi:hypothetical protein
LLAAEEYITNFFPREPPFFYSMAQGRWEMFQGDYVGTCVVVVVVVIFVVVVVVVVAGGGGGASVDVG